MMDQEFATFEFIKKQIVDLEDQGEVVKKLMIEGTEEFSQIFPLWAKATDSEIEEKMWTEISAAREKRVKAFAIYAELKICKNWLYEELRKLKEPIALDATPAAPGEKVTIQ